MLRSVSFTFLIGSILFAICLPTAAQSRTLPADSLIQFGKNQLDRGMKEGDSGPLRAARSSFERAAQRDTLRALSHYYAGLASYRLVDYVDDEDAALDAAIDCLKTATEHRPNWPEAHALLAAAYGRKAAGGMFSGMRYGPKSDNALDRARELAPDNPRVVPIDAIALLQKPSVFGGDEEKAVQKLKKASRLFAKRPAPDDPLVPSWGHAMTYAWLGIAHIKADRFDQAHTAFEKALSLRPKLHWVQEVLLPQLDAAKG
jgi:tetratricopeptide (TPR) repeat protein